MPEVPREVKDKLDRGRKAMLCDAAKRRLCMKFTEGDSYFFLDDRGVLNNQSTSLSVTGGKPRHRIRNRMNFIGPIVEAKVSAATQRVPSYEVLPSTTDPEDIGGARLAERVALYGYDKWWLREKTKKAVKLAIGGGGDGFAVPYFDPNVGPYTPVAENGKPRYVGQGEIRILTLSGNEVYWEEGVDFLESRWHAIERARSMEEVKRLPGFDGKSLTPDAKTSDIPTDRPSGDMVMVTEFFERPCPEYPEGRMMVLANARQILPEKPYPLRDRDGVIDEPVPHRLSYFCGSDTDRNLGLTWQLVDFQRTAQDIWNKRLEWKNRCLMPQMLAPEGSIVTVRTDEPGQIVYYRPIGGQKPEWERPVAVPPELAQMLDDVLRDMRYVAADLDLDAGPNVAARTVQQVVEQSANRWQSFLGDLAEFHSRLMRHCLVLVQNHYSEARTLRINGRFGPATIRDFKGAKLLGQVDVRVLPGSLAVRSRQQITQEVLAFADRGWITPQAAMAAIQGGTAEKLIESYELDVSKANRIIARIIDGTVMEMPTRHEDDPATGMPLLDEMGQPAEVPSWMPQPDVDNLQVWRAVFGDWMKTEDYEQVHPMLQDVAKQILAGIGDLERREQQQQMAAQAAQAEQAGMSNAARPQQPKPVPDMPKLDAA